MTAEEIKHYCEISNFPSHCFIDCDDPAFRNSRFAPGWWIALGLALLAGIALLLAVW